MIRFDYDCQSKHYQFHDYTAVWSKIRAYEWRVWTNSKLEVELMLHVWLWLNSDTKHKAIKMLCTAVRKCYFTKSGYTQENICNVNDHCNDDCNSSLECEFSRGRTNSYINTCVHKHKGHVSSASQKMFWMFSRAHVKFALWFEWNFTGIYLRTRIWIRDCD